MLLQARQLSSVSPLCSRHTRAGCHCRLPPCQEPHLVSHQALVPALILSEKAASRLLPPISSHCHPSQPRVSSSSSDSGQPSSLSSAIGPLWKTCPDWKLSSFLSSSAPHPGRPSLRHSSTHFSWNCSHFLPPWISSAEPH